MLITLEQARVHLRLPSAPADLELKLAAAEEIVLAFIARPDDVAWTATIATWLGSPAVEAPKAVQLAVLAQVAFLFANRGDERASDGAGGIAPDASALLRATGYRDPVVR